MKDDDRSDRGGDIPTPPEQQSHQSSHESPLRAPSIEGMDSSLDYLFKGSSLGKCSLCNRHVVANVVLMTSRKSGDY